MKPGQTDKLIEAVACLYRPTPPRTPEERAEFGTVRAREMARAQARREPSPQLDLPDA